MEIHGIKNISGGSISINGISFNDQETKNVYYDSTIFSNRAGDVLEYYTRGMIELYSDDNILITNGHTFELINRTADLLTTISTSSTIPIMGADGALIGPYAISTDTTFTNVTHTRLPTQYAIKSYVDSRLSGYSETTHDHDGDYLKLTGGTLSGSLSVSTSISEGGTLLSAKYAPIVHSHDDRYYTETEIDSLISGYSTSSHNHDSDYLKLSGGTITGELIIEQKLTLLGDTTVIHSTNVMVDDVVFTLGNGNTTDALDIGFIGVRASANIGLLWDESADEFATVFTDDDGSTEGNTNILGYTDFRANNVAVEGTLDVGGITIFANGTRTIKIDAGNGFIDATNTWLNLNRYSNTDVTVGGSSTANFHAYNNVVVDGTITEDGTLLSSKYAPTIHSHDDLYYTETEIDSLISGYSTSTHNHDSDYLKLTGGTLTGALLGTTSTFTGTGSFENGMVVTGTDATHIMTTLPLDYSDTYPTYSLSLARGNGGSLVAGIVSYQGNGQNLAYRSRDAHVWMNNGIEGMRLTATELTVTNDLIVAGTITETGTLLSAKYAPIVHSHDDLYYTETELSTSSSANVHWDNITNTPTTISSYGITDTIKLYTVDTDATIDTLFTGILSKTNSAWNSSIPKPDATTSANGIISLQTYSGNHYTQLGLVSKTNKLYIRSAYASSEFGTWEKLADETWTTTNFSDINHIHTTSDITGLDTTLAGLSINTHNHDSNYLKLTGGDLTGPIQFKDIQTSSSNSKINVIEYPQNASMSVSTGQVGLLKIAFPKTWSGTMLYMKLRIYDYTSDTLGTSIRLWGYNSETGEWKNCDCIIDGNLYTVTFGHDGTVCAVTIGDIDTEWYYSKIVLEEIQVSHNNTNDWVTGWQTTVETSVLPDIGPIFNTNTSHEVIVNNNVSATSFTETGTLLSDKYAPIVHSHDDLYYTETELSTSGSSSVHWGNVNNTPTTISGYGITNAIKLYTDDTDTDVNSVFTGILANANIGWNSTIPKPDASTNATGIISLQTHGGDYYTQLSMVSKTNKLYVRSAYISSEFGSWEAIADESWTTTNFSDISHIHATSEITGLDTTLSGLSLNTHNHDIDYAPMVHTHTFSELTSKPTTLSSYGITDGYTKTEIDTKVGVNTTDISTINTLLLSDDDTLDELQEIVDFVKLNRSDLDALTVAGVSGLQTELDSKVDKLTKANSLTPIITRSRTDDTQVASINYDGLGTFNITTYNSKAIQVNGVNVSLTDHVHVTSDITGLDTTLAGLSLNTHNHDSDYLKLMGGTLSGNLNITNTHPAMTLNSQGDNNYTRLMFREDDTETFDILYLNSNYGSSSRAGHLELSIAESKFMDVDPSGNTRFLKDIDVDGVIKEDGTLLSTKYAPISHNHTTSVITGLDSTLTGLTNDISDRVQISDGELIHPCDGISTWYKICSVDVSYTYYGFSGELILTGRDLYAKLIFRTNSLGLQVFDVEDYLGNFAGNNVNAKAILNKVNFTYDIWIYASGWSKPYYKLFTYSNPFGATITWYTSADYITSLTEPVAVTDEIEKSAYILPTKDVYHLQTEYDTYKHTYKYDGVEAARQDLTRNSNGSAYFRYYLSDNASSLQEVMRIYDSKVKIYKNLEVDSVITQGGVQVSLEGHSHAIIDSKADIVDTIKLYTDDNDITSETFTGILSKTNNDWNSSIIKPDGANSAVGIISLQTHTGDYYSQLGFTTGDNGLHFRSANNSTTFGSWAKIADETWTTANFSDINHIHSTSDITDLDTALAGLSLNTHNHDSDYLKLSGGTVTGHVILEQGLTVVGVSTILNSINVMVEDVVFTLGNGNTSDALDIGFIGIRASDNIGIIWDESVDEFAVIYTDDDGSTEGNTNILSYTDFRANNITEAGTLLSDKYAKINGDFDESFSVSTLTLQSSSGNTLTIDPSGEINTSPTRWLHLNKTNNDRVVVGASSTADFYATNNIYEGGTKLSSKYAPIVHNHDELYTASEEVRSITVNAVTGTDQSVDSIINTSCNGMRWDYVVYSTTDQNRRAGTIIATWTSTNIVEFIETSTLDIGDTSDLSFSVTDDTTNINLLVDATATYNVVLKAYRI